MVILVFILTSKYFLQVCGLSFHSRNGVLQKVEVIVLSILICFGTFVKNFFTIFKSVFELCSFYVSILLPKLPYFNYCSFKVSLEIR